MIQRYHQKRQKLTFEDDPERIEVNENSCVILKLNSDCLNEIFEYLSVKDLHSLGQTCKALQHGAGEYFHNAYLSATNFSGDNGIYTEYSDNSGAINQRTQTSGFNRYIRTIAHYYERMAPLQYIQLHSDEFESIHHIYLVCVPLNEVRIKCIEKLLGRVEFVQLKNCSVDDNADFYEIFLKFCSNLKQLYVQEDNFSRNRTRQYQSQYSTWLLQRYSHLEYLEFVPKFSSTLKDISAFFDQNPNVRSFSTSLTSIWKMRNEFLNCNAELDQLEVKVVRGARNNFENQDEIMASVCVLLNQLYERQFFKRLNIYVENLSQITRRELLSLNGLDKLCIKHYNATWQLPGLRNLSELALFNVSYDVDLESIAIELRHLQRLFLHNATVNHLHSFVRHSVNLTRVKFSFDAKHQYSHDIFNLWALNTERLKLCGARKMIIYVPDDIYLQIKWSAINGTMNFGFIEIKRSDSYVWNQFF